MEDYEYIEELELLVSRYQQDFEFVTASIAGVGTLLTLEQAWLGIQLLPSVQEAWCIALGWDEETSDIPVPVYVSERREGDSK